MDRLGRFIFNADKPIVALRPSVVAFADETDTFGGQIYTETNARVAWMFQNYCQHLTSRRYERQIQAAVDFVLAGQAATGDFNPVHLDQAYAEKTMFKGRIAHGALSIGFLSTVLGNILPGHGTIYLSQEAKFLAPVKIGDTVTAKVEVIELIPERNRAKFRTTCTNQDGKLVVDGIAWSMPPKKLGQVKNLFPGFRQCQ
jgi:3-hydroxybutyryl-CoA dehydratase